MLPRGCEVLLRQGGRVDLNEAFDAFGLRPVHPKDARIARVVREIERHVHAFDRLQDAAALACLPVSAAIECSLRRSAWLAVPPLSLVAANGRCYAHAAGFPAQPTSASYSYACSVWRPVIC